MASAATLLAAHRGKPHLLPVVPSASAGCPSPAASGSISFPAGASLGRESLAALLPLEPLPCCCRNRARRSRALARRRSARASAPTAPRHGRRMGAHKRHCCGMLCRALLTAHSCCQDCKDEQLTEADPSIAGRAVSPSTTAQPPATPPAIAATLLPPPPLLAGPAQAQALSSRIAIPTAAGVQGLLDRQAENASAHRRRHQRTSWLAEGTPQLWHCRHSSRRWPAPTEGQSAQPAQKLLCCSYGMLQAAPQLSTLHVLRQSFRLGSSARCPCYANAPGRRSLAPPAVPQ